MKKCPSCKTIKPDSSFGSNRAKTNGKQGKCRECHAKYAAYWYEKNKVEHKKRTRKWAIKREKEIRQFIQEYLRLNPCVDCGENNIIVLEFDHVRGIKYFNIADSLNKKCSNKKIMDEIKKCQVRCANCHRIQTYNRRKSRR